MAEQRVSQSAVQVLVDAVPVGPNLAALVTQTAVLVLVGATEEEPPPEPTPARAIIVVCLG